MTIIDAETGEVLVRGNGDALVGTPGPIVLHKTGLEVVGELAFDEWRQFGANLTAVQGSIHWWIGDWLNFGERKYGETYAQAVEDTGFNIETLRHDAWVASKIELCRRRHNLSFGHHLEVAAREIEEQEYWLSRAEAGTDSTPWSVHELRRMMKAQPWLLSESNEWYTPRQYIEAARAVLGGFDIDPASSDRANETVRAATYYTAETNGLDKDWPGRVWLNPPYGGLSGPFAARLVEQYEAGITTEAILLVNANSTDTSWFAPLWDYTLCFTNHRINFVSPEGASKNGSTHGSVFIYLGDNDRAFFDYFHQFGVVVRRVRYDEHS